MTLSHATIDFAGIQIDTFLTEDHQAYATLTSICKGLKVSNQNAIDWVRRHNKGAEGIPVNVGKRQVPATAFPISLIGDFLDYRVSLKDEQVLALYSATFRADLISDIKRANLVSVTHAEQNELRAEIRMDLVKSLVKGSRCKVTKASHAIYVADLAAATEQEQEIAIDIVCMNDAQKRVDKYMTTLKHTEYETQVNGWDMSNIERNRAKLEAQGVSC